MSPPRRAGRAGRLARRHQRHMYIRQGLIPVMAAHAASGPLQPPARDPVKVWSAGRRPPAGIIGFRAQKATFWALRSLESEGLVTTRLGEVRW